MAEVTSEHGVGIEDPTRCAPWYGGTGVLHWLKAAFPTNAGSRSSGQGVASLHRCVPSTAQPCPWGTGIPDLERFNAPYDARRFTRRGGYHRQANVLPCACAVAEVPCWRASAHYRGLLRRVAYEPTDCTITAVAASEILGLRTEREPILPPSSRQPGFGADYPENRGKASPHLGGAVACAAVPETAGRRGAGFHLWRHRLRR